MLLLEYCHHQVLAGVEEQKGKTPAIQHSAANEAPVSEGKAIVTNERKKQAKQFSGYKQ